jgi:hypothetical protein
MADPNQQKAFIKNSNKRSAKSMLNFSPRQILHKKKSTIITKKLQFPIIRKNL